MLILSRPPPISNFSPNPRIASPTSLRFSSSSSNLLPPQCQTAERGHEFATGGTFYRRESAVGRDLGVLAASLHRQSSPQLRVLDAMCGCGIRSLRYLLEAGADFVLANDANDENMSVIARNLSRVSGEGRWLISSNEANRVMTECYLKRDFYDLVDVDSFGSESSYLRSAMNCLKLGGLLYVTSTDGYSSGGHRPHHTLAAYGAYVRPLPYSNEVGLRMLIGGAVREASVLGYHVTPLFSYYSYHGPVFRVMLRLNRGKILTNRHYEFIGYCTKCGHSQSYSWDELGKLSCTCNKEGGSLVVSGPLWTGPLHSASYLIEMLNMAEQLGWMGNGAGTDLQKLLQLMVDESDPKLPFGYIKLDEVASRAKINSPPLRTMMSALQKVTLILLNIAFQSCMLPVRRDMQLVGHTLQPMPLRRTVLWLHALELPRRFSTVNQSWCKVAVLATVMSGTHFGCIGGEATCTSGSKSGHGKQTLKCIQAVPDLGAAGDPDLEPSHEKHCLKYSDHMRHLVSSEVPT